MFLFHFNKEKRFGYKLLSNPELKQGTSHQSHIGLYERVLTFLDNTNVVKSAMFIYENHCEILDCSFDRIKREDGKHDSPKIRIGADPNKSVVSRIRQIVAESPKANWYLVWAGLESEELVFWLIKEGSADYMKLSGIVPKANKVYDEKDMCYAKAIRLFTRKLNSVSIGIQRDIEIASQLGDLKSTYKRADVERAERLFRSIGKKGEELVAEYLDRQRHEGIISSYIWENQSNESGLPYDFKINNSLLVDVKSTKFDFEQNIFFSNEEVRLASCQNDHYQVYRVYDLTGNSANMKICSQCNPYLSVMNQNIARLEREMVEQEAKMHSLKISVLPQKCFENIQLPIKLG